MSMHHVVLQKVAGGVLAPADEVTDAFLRKLPMGHGIEFQARIRRNIKFHRKAFLLLRLAYDAWCELNNGLDTQDRRVTFTGFREWILIAAGHHEQHFFPDGTFVVHAKSLAFDKCDEVEFNTVYSSVLDVCWDRVLQWANYSGPQEVEKTVSRLMTFS